jgi:hypothetical protein
MAVFELQGPDGKVYEVEAPSADAAVGAFKQFQPQRSRHSVVAEFPKLPTVLQQFPDDLGHTVAASSFLNPTDAQLADIVQNKLGDKFVRREIIQGDGQPLAPDAQPGTRASAARRPSDAYDVFVTRGPDGQEQRGYLNAPGLDGQDVARGVLGSLPYAASGSAATLLGVGRGLIANAVLQGGSSAATSVAADAALIPLGSEQGIDGGKAILAGAFGTAGPPLSRGAGNSYQFVRDRIGNTPAEVARFERGAVNRIAGGMDADRLEPIGYDAQRQRLGQEGMLADMGENLRADAAVLARTPGANKTVVMDALERRGVLAPGRIRQEVDAALGPAGNQRAYVEQQRTARNQQAAPFYRQFHETTIAPNRELDAHIFRIQRALPGAFNEARRLAIADGVEPQFIPRLVDDPMNAITGTQASRQGPQAWTGAELDYLKRAVDTVANKARDQGDRDGLRIFGGLARSLRNTVDDILSPGAPAQSPWAQARAITGEALEAEDALEMGSRVFTEKRDPFQVREELASLSQLGQDVYRRGARDDVRGTMGRASTAYGPNGDTAARRQFQNDFNRENLEILAGEQPAQYLTRRIDAETEFARTNDLATRNSVTATMEAAKKRIPGAQTAESDISSELGKKGPIGLATEAVARVLNALMNNTIGRRNETLRTDMARILTATGPERDRIVRGLMEIRQRRGLRREEAAAIERVLNVLNIGARGTAAPALQELQ